MLLVRAVLSYPVATFPFIITPLFLSLSIKVWKAVVSLVFFSKESSLLLRFLAGTYGIPFAFYLTLLSYAFFQTCLHLVLSFGKKFSPCQPFFLNTVELLSLIVPGLKIEGSSLLVYPKG